MKRINKKDFIYCLLLVVSFLLFVGLLTSTKFLYGSSVDWSSQHITFPEYFRQLFYQTKNLFPEFAFNIGSGQNIYNFSYYGLFNPIILISYLFPWVSMSNYIMISTIICCIVSAIMMYFWLKRRGNSELVAFAGAFLFLFSSSITFHSHRHVMFINYMPFLILGLYGVDLKLKYKKNWLLILSVFLMILTSYYFSVGGIISLGIYGVYEYLRTHDKVEIKKYLLDLLSFIYPFIIGILMASILLIPTFMALLSGRSDTSVTVSLFDLLLPKFNADFYLYEGYGVGLTAIALLALINFIKKKKENIFLSIILGLILLFGIFTYLLNGGMYIDAKVLIPFLPIFIIIIVEFINDLFNKKILIKNILKNSILLLILTVITYEFNSNLIILFFDLLVIFLAIYFYKKTNKKIVFILPILLFAYGVSYGISTRDKLVDAEQFNNNYTNNRGVINYILKRDNDYFRINTYLGAYTNNNIYENMNNYMSTVYSSLSNIEYNNFYYDLFNNNIQSRNRSITSNTANLLFNDFSGNKYLVSKSLVDWIGYEYVDKVNGYYIYKNENVLPLGYATNNLISEKEFDNLNYPYNIELLMNNIVVNDKDSSEYKSYIIKHDIDINRFDFDGLNVEYSDNKYRFDIKDKKKKITYKLCDEVKNKILFVRFKVFNDNPKDTVIKVNGNANKLTRDGWKYHNNNFLFDYVISVKDLDELNISFSEGHYELGDFELYYLDYEHIKKKKVDALNIIKMEDNIVVGNIDVTNDGYFTLSIPYDHGFKAIVDGKEVEVEKVNKAYIGFKINKGQHVIEVIYNNPYKDISMLISLIGLCLYAIIITIEWKR